MIENNPGNALGNARTLHDAHFLDKLKHIVAVKPSEIMTPTGVPPYVHQLKIIRLMHEDKNELSSNFS